MSVEQHYAIRCDLCRVFQTNQLNKTSEHAVKVARFDEGWLRLELRHAGDQIVDVCKACAWTISETLRGREVIKPGRAVSVDASGAVTTATPERVAGVIKSISASFAELPANPLGVPRPQHPTKRECS